jgi:hypothetical protein
MMEHDRDREDVRAYAEFRGRILGDFTPKDAGQAAAADALAGRAWALEGEIARVLGERPDGRPRVSAVQFMRAADVDAL